ncbi:hypothetical protein BDV93DRAFT_544580 [Ceratobasidium sp. AG-I]|nr:hypothetical protein BDV93DRAFT_544580 [Ceratobasidium sp. AG-I]
MLLFNRLASLFALFVSFALFSYALPTGVIESRADATELVAKFASFHSEMSGLAQGLGSLAATGESPATQVQKIATSFSTMSTYLSKSKAKPTYTEEEQISSEVTGMIVKLADSANLVAAKGKYVTWYPTWTELDVAMHSFLCQLSRSISYRVYQTSLKNVGSEACTDFHQMKMRLMVNDLLGMGVGYN